MLLSLVWAWNLAAHEFDPASIPGLQLWLKSDSGIQMETSSRALMLWQDQSGLQHHLHNLIEPAGRPLHNLEMVHGLPAVRFDGADDFLVSYPFVQVGFNKMALFMVYRPLSATAGNGVLSWRYHESLGNDNHDRGTNSLYYTLNSVTGAGLSGQNYSLDTRPFVQGDFYVATFGHGNGLFLRRNGEPIAAGAARNIPMNLDAFVMGARQINNGVRASFGRSDVAEVLIYNTELTAAQIQEVEHYLLERYDLEPGPMKLQPAPRVSFQDASVVTVHFSEAPLPSTALVAGHYLLNNGITVTSVEPGPSPTAYVLRTSPPLESTGTYVLEVQSIRNAAGRSMYRSNSVATIARNLVLPAEFGLPLRGFQDHFEGSARNPQWRVAGSADVYQQLKGVLRVGAAGGQGNALLVNGTYAASQEVLARVQWIRPGDNDARPGWVLNQNGAGTAVRVEWRQAGATRTASVLAGEAPEQAFTRPWSPNHWHWVRIQQRPAAAGAVEIRYTVWRADYDTPEPAAETITVPAGTALPVGQAGILPLKQAGHYHVDYILVKAEGLPEITPFYQPPPALLNLLATGEPWQLFWSVDPPGYSLYASELLDGWGPPAGQLRMEEGLWVFDLAEPAVQQFFQLQRFP